MTDEQLVQNGSHIGYRRSPMKNTHKMEAPWQGEPVEAGSKGPDDE